MNTSQLLHANPQQARSFNAHLKPIYSKSQRLRIRKPTNITLALLSMHIPIQSLQALINFVEIIWLLHWIFFISSKIPTSQCQTTHSQENCHPLRNLLWYLTWMRLWFTAMNMLTCPVMSYFLFAFQMEQWWKLVSIFGLMQGNALSSSLVILSWLSSQPATNAMPMSSSTTSTPKDTSLIVSLETAAGEARKDSMWRIYEWSTEIFEMFCWLTM